MEDNSDFSEEENWMETYDQISSPVENITSKNNDKHSTQESCLDTNLPVCSSANISPSPPLSRIGLNTHKAGMEGLDKAKINQIILETSKGSKFYEQEIQREKKVSLRVNEMLERLKWVTKAELLKAQQLADSEIEKLEWSRDSRHIVVHIDMDAFYAAVEIRDNPKLKDIPMAVGGSSMLSTSNYVARRFGVRAAMPGFIAKKLCPELIIVKPHFDKYKQVSEEVRDILREYDPHFSSVGLDEAFLDLTSYVTQLMKIEGSENISVDLEPDRDDVHQECIITSDATTVPPLCDQDTAQSSFDIPSEHDETGLQNENESNYDNPSYCCALYQLSKEYWECAQRVVKEIRQRVQEKTKLTASAGIAPNKMLAKICSDMNKPNGQFFIEPSRESVIEFVRKLPIRKVSGIGKVTEKMLNALSIKTCQDLYDKRAKLKVLFSETSSHHFIKIAMGLGSNEVHSEWERKSISTERTFAELSKPEELLLKCQDLCHSLVEEMAEEKLKGRTVTLKMKTIHFEVKQRSLSVPHPISSFHDVYQIASQLLHAEMKSCSPSPLRLRLMGVRLSALEIERHRKRAATLDSYFQQDDNCKRMKSNVTEDERDLSVEEADSNKIGINSVQGRETVKCPVCSKRIIGDNVELNQHIDECLNQSVITSSPEKDYRMGTSHSHKSTSPEKDYYKCKSHSHKGTLPEKDYYKCTSPMKSRVKCIDNGKNEKKSGHSEVTNIQCLPLDVFFKQL